MVRWRIEIRSRALLPSVSALVPAEQKGVYRSRKRISRRACVSPDAHLCVLLPAVCACANATESPPRPPFILH